MTETASPRPGETPARGPSLVREIVSVGVILAGVAGAILCLVHLGWWVTGLALSILVLVLGVRAGLRRDDETPETRIEI